MAQRDPRATVQDPEEVPLGASGESITARRVDHELFGSVLAPDTLGSLTRLVQFVTAAWGAAGWRGQSSLRWKIDSGLARRVRTHSGGFDEPADRGGSFPSRALVAEQQLLARARALGHDRRDGDLLSDLQLSALLQHHGAGTRLLDCSANAYVALWFACRGDPSHYGLLASFDLSGARLITAAEERTSSMGQLLSETEGTFGAWRPAGISPRIAAQQALFVFSEIIDEPWGSIRFDGGESTALTGKVPGLRLFAISPELKSELAGRWIDLFGYAEETLFPDVDGFARVHGAAEPFPPDFF